MAIRADARAYERALPLKKRKELGQFFTGLPLGKLLAHLALNSDTHTVLDPMAGHGDLLDATWEAATERGIKLKRLDGIEIDEMTAAACRHRLAGITGNHGTYEQQITAGDAFDPDSVAGLALSTYDLVITNPPYVRYQARTANGSRGEQARSGLKAVIDRHLSGVDEEVWSALTEGYSGLADLSVPACLLSALMVRPGGCLALVIPATWRSRDYADVIRYLLLRCFSLECIVEDKQPGWFSDALVRTHLIVAQRLPTEDIAKPLRTRARWPTATWLQVAPEAADARSLVGAAFDKNDPEAQFANWKRRACAAPKCGISVRNFDMHQEWTSLETRIKRRRWYRKLEGSAHNPPLFFSDQSHPRVTIPDLIKDILPNSFASHSLLTLEETGIQIGQGLRTGCNQFFYVTACSPSDADMVRVLASPFFGRHNFFVPASALLPVLRRQSEITSFEDNRIPEGRVLDLRSWVLPEDFEIVTQAEAAYATRRETVPQIMPDELAAYVRKATSIPLDGVGDDRRIPDLSAVRTNTRLPRNGDLTPRFWYMLPDFAPRHLPAAFVARINHSLPWVEANFDPPILIDANFATFWAPKGDWTRHALKALLNSVWCRAFMEALGTPFGGGALKLEATHLRQMAIPVLSDAAKEELDTAGKQLTRNDASVQSRIDKIVLNAVLPGKASRKSLPKLAKIMIDRAYKMSCARQRAA